jgi:type I restriction enzyme S subunit
MCAPDSLVGVVPHWEEDAQFIELCVSRRKRWLFSRAPQSAQKNINLEDLRPLQIPWPENDERQSISEKCRIIDMKIEALENQLSKFKLNKSGLMHDLLTGRVQVNPDPSEVAHV